MTKQELTAELTKREARYELAKKSGTLPEAVLAKEAQKITDLKAQIENMPDDEPVKPKKAATPVVKTEPVPSKTPEEIEQEAKDELAHSKELVIKRKAYQGKKEYYQQA